MNYVIDSGDHQNLQTFLMPKYSKEPTFTFGKKKYFLTLLNQQFLHIQGVTIYEQYLNNVFDGEKTNFLIIFNLLEEKKFFLDILNDDSVQFKKLKDFAVSEKVSSENCEKMFEVDDLVGNIIAYCSKDDRSYTTIKAELEKVGIVYKMLFIILEHRENEFEQSFDDFKLKISDFYQNRYKNLRKSSYYTSNFMLMFLIAAMKHNQRKVVDLILSHETFNTVILRFPENIDTGSIYNYVALKMLQNGHCIGKNQIPSCWITPKVMNDFLDSQVVYRGHNLVELNSGFMLHPFTKKWQVRSENDVDEKLVFWEDTDSLRFLIENENVKNSITHPIVSTYIDLKTFKYYRIYFWNFVAFLSSLVLTFTVLMIMHFTFNTESDPQSLAAFNQTVLNGIEMNQTAENLNSTSNFGVHIWHFLCFLSLIFVIGREFFQFKYIEGNDWRKYFSKKTNCLEVFMLVFAAVLLFFFTFADDDFVKKKLPLPSALFVLVLAIEVLCLIPISSSQQYTMIIKNVAGSFPKFFAFFGVMLIPFSFCFCIIFRNKTDGEFFLNFQSFWTSLFKSSLMLAGEYSIELFKLDAPEMIFVSFFVLTTFWLYALIIGFSVCDIKELKENARKNILEENSKKILKMGEFFFEIYKSHE